MRRIIGAIGSKHVRFDSLFDKLETLAKDKQPSIILGACLFLNILSNKGL
jgi:hypothetical protein